MVLFSTVNGGAVDSNSDGDEVDGLLDKLVAAFGSLGVGALVLGCLAWSGAGHEVLGRESDGHDGEGDKGDDVLELHFDCLGGLFSKD